MASTRRNLGVCDICGFEYPYRTLKMNSYGLLVCPRDDDIKYDLKNHPQNRIPHTRDNEAIQNPRPDQGDVYVPVTVTDWLPS
jgi:hypothetical protein